MIADFNKEMKAWEKDTNNSEDFVIKVVNGKSGRFALIYIDGMVDTRELNEGVLSPLINASEKFDKSLKGLQSVLETPEEVIVIPKRADAVQSVCSGDACLVFEGATEYFLISVKMFPQRSVEEPPTSTTVKGPREGFVENVKTNIILIRRRFAGNDLIIKKKKIGRLTQTAIAITYLKSVANLEIVEAIERKLDEIDIDGVVSSSYITTCLEEKKYSIFKQIGTTEKPDILARKMLDGRIGIIVDGSPIVLTLPFALIEDFFDQEDYFRRPVRTTLVRIMRLMSVFFAVFLPAMYVAVESYQFQILPTKLLITITNSIYGIPFTPIIEMLVALVLFEALGEASIRMPRYVGMAISILGGIILGETAVKAGILSSLTVLITAISSIGLYAVPDEVGAFSVIRIGLVMIAGSLGLYGILLATFALVSYVVTIEIYDVPFMVPFAPISQQDLNDSVIKAAESDIKKRNNYMHLKNRTSRK